MPRTYNTQYLLIIERGQLFLIESAIIKPLLPRLLSYDASRVQCENGREADLAFDSIETVLWRSSWVKRENSVYLTYIACDIAETAVCRCLRTARK